MRAGLPAGAQQSHHLGILAREIARRDRTGACNAQFLHVAVGKNCQRLASLSAEEHHQSDEFVAPGDRQFVFAHAAGLFVPFDDARIESQRGDIAIGQDAAHGFVLIEFAGLGRTENIVARHGRRHAVTEIAIGFFEHVETRTHR